MLLPLPLPLPLPPLLNLATTAGLKGRGGSTGRGSGLSIAEGRRKAAVLPPVLLLLLPVLPPVLLLLLLRTLLPTTQRTPPPSLLLPCSTPISPVSESTSLGPIMKMGGRRGGSGGRRGRERAKVPPPLSFGSFSVFLALERDVKTAGTLVIPMGAQLKKRR